jgi:hypothetical protein
MSAQLSLLDDPAVDAMLGPADRAAAAAVEAMLSESRRRGEQEPALALLATTLGASRRSQLSLVTEARDLRMSRLRGANRGESTLRAYRNAIDDPLAWGPRSRSRRGPADRGRDGGASRLLPAHALADAGDLPPAFHPAAAIRAVGLSAARVAGSVRGSRCAAEAAADGGLADPGRVRRDARRGGLRGGSSRGSPSGTGSCSSPS